MRTYGHSLYKVCLKVANSIFVEQIVPEMVYCIGQYCGPQEEIKAFMVRDMKKLGKHWSVTRAGSKQCLMFSVKQFLSKKVYFQNLRIFTVKKLRKFAIDHRCSVQIPVY